MLTLLRALESAHYYLLLPSRNAHFRLVRASNDGRAKKGWYGSQLSSWLDITTYRNLMVSPGLSVCLAQLIAMLFIAMGPASDFARIASAHLFPGTLFSTLSLIQILQLHSNHTLPGKPTFVYSSIQLLDSRLTYPLQLFMDPC